jgi:hypothetical protein
MRLGFGARLCRVDRGNAEAANLAASWSRSGRADLNRRPHGPEPCALAGLSHAPNALSLPQQQPKRMLQYQRNV